MNIKDTISILEALAAGCSPKTGQIVESESVLNERDVIRALQIAINELKSIELSNITKSSTQKKKNYTVSDFFQKETFNNLTKTDIDEIISKVKSIGILKTLDLSEYIISARKSYPRAYEAWSDQEKDLLSKALQKTNDLEILSQCFQRGKGSIESFGQKLFAESGSENSATSTQ